MNPPSENQTIFKSKSLKKVIILKIKDVNSNNRIKIKNKIKEVMKRIDKLNKDLEAGE